MSILLYIYIVSRNKQELYKRRHHTPLAYVAHMRTTVQFCAPDLCKFVSGASWKPKNYQKFQRDVMLLLFVGL